MSRLEVDYRRIPLPSSPGEVVAMVAQVAQIQRDSGAYLLELIERGRELGVAIRPLAKAAGMKPTTLFQQVSAGQPIAVLRRGNHKPGERVEEGRYRVVIGHPGGEREERELELIGRKTGAWIFAAVHGGPPLEVPRNWVVRMERIGDREEAPRGLAGRDGSKGPGVQRDRLGAGSPQGAGGPGRVGRTR